MRVATCRKCQQEKPDEEPFMVPIGDGIGETLLAGHFEDVHGISWPAEVLRTTLMKQAFG